MKSLITFSFNLKLITKFSIVFIVLTIIGTTTHELAHYVVAEIFNFNPTLHYDSVSYSFNKYSIDNYFIKTVFVELAGPIQTMITGTIGFLLLYKGRKHLDYFTFSEWTFLFLSLFWMRQVFNLLVSILKFLLYDEVIFGGDEGKVSLMLNLDSSILSIIAGLIGITICYIVVFVFLPIKYRINLIIGCLAGSIVGILIGEFIKYSF